MQSFGVATVTLLVFDSFVPSPLQMVTLFYY